MSAQNTIYSVSVALAAAQAAIGTMAVKERTLSTSSNATMKSEFASMSTPDLITVTAEQIGSGANLRIERTFTVVSREWSEKDDSRFDYLVTQEAIGSISNEEVQELDSLQQKRRGELAPASGEERLRQYAQWRIDQGMLDLLRKHVHIEPIAGNSLAVTYSVAQYRFAGNAQGDAS